MLLRHSWYWRPLLFPGLPALSCVLRGICRGVIPRDGAKVVWQSWTGHALSKQSNQSWSGGGVGGGHGATGTDYFIFTEYLANKESYIIYRRKRRKTWRTVCQVCCCSSLAQMTHRHPKALGRANKETTLSELGFRLSSSAFIIPHTPYNQFIYLCIYLLKTYYPVNHTGSPQGFSIQYNTIQYNTI